MTLVTIPSRFRGPPQSGNGGYVAGLMARLAGGHRAVAMRAPAPLDTPMTFDGSGETARLLHGDTLIAEAAPASPGDLATPPLVPTLEQARAASQGYQSFHPICVCCGDKLSAAEGLRVLAGPVSGAPEGTVAAAWDVDPAFCDADGLAPEEVVWTALDCPGFYAWVAHDGRHGALTGRMQAEVLERPRGGEPCVVLAWPLERVSERRQTAGVALFGADGRLMARAVQTWIRVVRRAEAA